MRDFAETHRPVVGVFYALRQADAGQHIVDSLRPDDGGEVARDESALRSTARRWTDESIAKAERVGRRYGWFGLEKRDRSAEPAPPTSPDDAAQVSRAITGDLANVAAAYVIVKVSADLLCGPLTCAQLLLPVRLGLSVYLSPPLARVAGRAFGGLGARVLKRTS